MLWPISGRGIGDRDAVVGKRGTSDSTQRLVAHHQALAELQTVTDRRERPALALFRALSVADVHRGGIVVSPRQGGADAGIHPSAQEDHRAGFGA